MDSKILVNLIVFENLGQEQPDPPLIDSDQAAFYLMGTQLMLRLGDADPVPVGGGGGGGGNVTGPDAPTVQNAIPYMADTTGMLLAQSTLTADVNGILSTTNPDSAFIDVAPGHMLDSDDVVSLDWAGRILGDGNGTENGPSIDWENRYLFSVDSNIALDWANRWLKNADFSVPIDWGNRSLNDASSLAILTWSSTGVLVYQPIAAGTGQLVLRGAPAAGGNGFGVGITGTAADPAGGQGGNFSVTTGDGAVSQSGGNIQFFLGGGVLPGAFNVTGASGAWTGAPATWTWNLGANSSGAGAAFSLIAGQATGTAGNGGSLTLQSGSASAASGAGVSGTINLSTGNANGAGGTARSGAMTIQTGTALGNSGALTIQTGTSGATGGLLIIRGQQGTTAGGAVNILAGPGATGGVLSLASGQGTGGGPAGALTITGGSANAGGTGATVTIAGGASATGTNGGVVVRGANTASAVAGGTVSILGGTGGAASAGTGGAVTVQGGVGSTNSNGVGGVLLIAGGDSTNTNGTGALATLRGGNGAAAGSGVGGNAVVAAGTGATGGVILLQTAGSTRVTIDATGNVTATGQVRMASLGIGNFQSATSLGALVGVHQVFDASGAALGYAPVYASFT